MNFRALSPWRGSAQPLANRRDDYDPFVSMRQEMDRVFDTFFGAPDTRPQRGFPAVTPALDISETEKEVVVSAELPGLDEKDFEVTLTGDVLTLKGEKKVEEERKDGDTHYVERRYGSFSRSVRLPFVSGGEQVAAQYDKGVLTVRIPKPAEARNAARRIAVKTA